MATTTNFTHINLVSKIDSPKNMSHIRLISLYNVSYKIIAKILTDQMPDVMPFVICENQSVFATYQFIYDNILVVYELLHILKTKKKDIAYNMVLKLDMSKAYDRVE